MADVVRNAQEPCLKLEECPAGKVCDVTAAHCMTCYHACVEKMVISLEDCLSLCPPDVVVVVPNEFIACSQDNSTDEKWTTQLTTINIAVVSILCVVILLLSVIIIIGILINRRRRKMPSLTHDDNKMCEGLSKMGSSNHRERSEHVVSSIVSTDNSFGEFRNKSDQLPGRRSIGSRGDYISSVSMRELEIDYSGVRGKHIQEQQYYQQQPLIFPDEFPKDSTAVSEQSPFLVDQPSTTKPKQKSDMKDATTSPEKQVNEVSTSTEVPITAATSLRAGELSQMPVGSDQIKAKPSSDPIEQKLFNVISRRGSIGTSIDESEDETDPKRTAAAGNAATSLKSTTVTSDSKQSTPADDVTPARSRDTSSPRDIAPATPHSQGTGSRTSNPSVPMQLSHHSSRTMDNSMRIVPNSNPASRNYSPPMGSRHSTSQKSGQRVESPHSRVESRDDDAASLRTRSKVNSRDNSRSDSARNSQHSPLLRQPQQHGANNDDVTRSVMDHPRSNGYYMAPQAEVGPHHHGDNTEPLLSNQLQPLESHMLAESALPMYDTARVPNIHPHFPNDEYVSQPPDLDSAELEYLRNMHESTPLRPTLDAIRVFPWVEGYSTEGNSIDVFVNFQNMSQAQALAELCHVSGELPTRFNVKSSKFPELRHNRY